jgi:hypothetical protein
MPDWFDRLQGRRQLSTELLLLLLLLLLTWIQNKKVEMSNRILSKCKSEYSNFSLRGHHEVKSFSKARELCKHECYRTWTVFPYISP